MIFKCKICGGSLDVKQGEKITVCEYCGVRQAIPTFIEPKIEEIYNRANNYLMHNEFDKAENLFNQILFDDNSNADAYWNILMCRYGVSYVKDPTSGKYIPTCNRTLYTPIFNDGNYKKALQYADETQKELYSIDAKTIDEIQKGILAVSRKEKPFDIFISYKETDIKGTRTQDSIVAQDLYNKLTAEGYKVFFSRITLEDKAGTEYEPYIYAALASSKVMITICSSRENIEAVWVKNEWSRFFSFAGKDSEKTLIPLYYNMDKSDLPEEFTHLPSYNMKVDGFEQDLIRGIKKLIPLPIMLLEQRKKRNKILKRIGIGAAVCAVVGTICSIPWFMKMPEYNAAMQLYYDKNYAEATWAFDELGGYRDSQKMKEKCELSWRNRFATVVAGYDDIFYYITPNGTVESFNNMIGDSHKYIEINEHGKPLSLGRCNDNPLYVLYEDGYVANVVENNQLQSDDSWYDIVQISDMFSDVFSTTNVALRADGKMMYGKTEITDKYGYKVEDNWIKPISKWENIITFDYISSEGNSTIVGIKSDGTLCMVSEGIFSEIPKDLLNKFYNVKTLNIGYHHLLSESKYFIKAFTNNNTIMILEDGRFDEYDANDIIDIYTSYDFNGNRIDYELNSRGELITDSKVVLEDVVYLNYGFAVTRSGSVYRIEKNGVENKNVKAIVYDEWIERLK